MGLQVPLLVYLGVLVYAAWRLSGNLSNETLYLLITINPN